MSPGEPKLNFATDWRYAAAPESSEHVRIAPQYELYIGGEFVAPAAGRYFDTVNPATGQLLSRVALAEAGDVDRAVRAARAAYAGTWSQLAARERGKYIYRIARLLQQRAREFAIVESMDGGKPIRESRDVDIPLAAAHFFYYAGWADKLDYAFPGRRARALGIAGQIIPWNFPLLMAAWKLGPALACGCTVVLKPAEQTPLSALRLGELFQEAGIPDGVVNIVAGYGETAGAALAVHPDVDKVAFTGSTEVGKLILQAAAGNLKKVSLELGGKSPNVVFADADLKTAIPGAASAIFFNHGQCCCAGSRLYVEEKAFDQVVDGVAQKAAKIRVGSGLDSTNDMGPLVSEEQLNRVCKYLSSGKAEGAKAVVGGERLGDKGYFVKPTVLVNTNENMKVVKEEIFGPVVTAIPFRDPEELMPKANDSIYGLAAGVWSSDLKKAHTTAAKLKAGTVWINCYNIFDAALPFGGYKQSGWGREMGHEVLEHYTETKAVCAAL
jgi:phenylacetaldehyde dehydrogenase